MAITCVLWDQTALAKALFLKNLICASACVGGKKYLLMDKCSHITARKKLAQLISYVPQTGGSHLSFNVEEFVRMARYSYHHIFSEWQSQDQDAVENALTITDSQPFRFRKMSTLSGGECQRVMIAAALAQDTPVFNVG